MKPKVRPEAMGGVNCITEAVSQSFPSLEPSTGQGSLLPPAGWTHPGSQSVLGFCLVSS